jgi:diguanylate cyclase (GGDEF)-like protein
MALGYFKSFHEERNRNHGVEVSRRLQVLLHRTNTRLTKKELQLLASTSPPDKATKLHLYRQLTSAFQQNSQRDALTGLFNRGYFDAQSRRLFQRAKRLNDELTLVIADLDLFKRVNDELGHDVGDQVLTRVARILREGTREGDVVARIGGEELALLLVDVPPDEALPLCERLRSAVERHAWAEIHPDLRVTVSMGLAGSRSVDSFAALYKAADVRLYEAKRNGRNRVSGGPPDVPVLPQG